MKNFAGLFVLVSVSWVSVCWAAPAQVLMIRHAEKPSSGPDLSPQGYQRAQAYVNYFETNPAVLSYGTPVAIYAMAQTSPTDTARPIETVTPLANALGLTIHHSITKYDAQDLVNEIMSTPAYDGKMVLICWEHKAMTPIAQQFGVTDAPKYPGSDFNWVWELDFTNGALSNFTTFRANILPSDGPNSLPISISVPPSRD